MKAFLTQEIIDAGHVHIPNVELEEFAIMVFKITNAQFALIR